ncbi:MAG: hypothetical protein IIB36_19360 [Gemmatimonadetes bacterium]|nr:hypothetical protein [Gemmatimonadota bacterium]
MTAADLLRVVREQGVELTPDGDQLRYRGPREALTPDMLIELKRLKPDILALLSTPHETHPCSRCQRFTFPEAGVVCYWCRSTPEADA